MKSHGIFGNMDVLVESKFNLRLKIEIDQNVGSSHANFYRFHRTDPQKTSSVVSTPSSQISKTNSTAGV